MYINEKGKEDKPHNHPIVERAYLMDREYLKIDPCGFKKRDHKPHYWLHPDYSFTELHVGRRCPGKGRYARELNPQSNDLEGDLINA